MRLSCILSSFTLRGCPRHALLCYGLGTAHLFEIGNQSGSGWAPSEPLPGLCARSWHIEGREHREPSKMSRRFLRREADHWHLQDAANDFSDLPHRYSFFSDRVVPAAGFVLLQSKPVEMGNIENMRRRPAIESLANIRRSSLFTGCVDRVGNEALLDRVVNLRKTHHRHVHTMLRHGSAGDFRHFTRIRVVGIEMVFGCGLTWNSVPHSGSGGDHDGSVRSPERISESFDGAPVLVTDLRELREIVSECAVIESAVNHPIRFGRPGAQAFQVFKIPSMHLGAGGNERPSTSVRPRQSKYLMARFDEFRNNGRTDKAGSPSEKDTHIFFSFRPVRVAYRRQRH